MYNSMYVHIQLSIGRLKSSYLQGEDNDSLVQTSSMIHSDISTPFPSRLVLLLYTQLLLLSYSIF